MSETREARAEAAEVVRILDAHDQLIYSGKGVPAPEAIRDNSRIRVEVRELAACVAQAEAERDAALAVIERVGSIADDFVDDGYKPGRTIWSIKDAVATSPSDALDAVKAAAWDEYSRRMREDGSIPDWVTTRLANPYRIRNTRTPGEETTNG